MKVIVRYSKARFFSKYISLDQPVTKLEAICETAPIAELNLSEYCTKTFKKKIDLEFCEEVYHLLNVNQNTYINQSTLVEHEVFHTSMSVGDIVIFNNKWFQVMKIGFKEITVGHDSNFNKINISEVD